jgi:hypothetical protein
MMMHQNHNVSATENSSKVLFPPHFKYMECRFSDFFIFEVKIASSKFYIWNLNQQFWSYDLFVTKIASSKF